MTATTASRRTKTATSADAHRSNSRLVLGLLGAFGFLTAVWPVWLSFSGPGPVHVAPLVAHVAGMLAGYGVLMLMILMSRWPVLEKGIGSDRLARWHAIGGRTVLTLVLVHAYAAVQAWADARQENLLLALWHVLGFAGLLTATLGTMMMSAIAVLSVRAARRRLSYETWHGLHLGGYVAIALTFTHQLAGPDLAGHRLAQVLLALAYAHAFGLVIRHRVLTPLRTASRHRLRVAAVVPEAPGVVSILLSGRHLRELRAESGQFFRWRFLTPETWYAAHPFSLSAPPTDDQLRLTIKALGDGSRLMQSLEVGTWVVAEGPYGAMTAARRSQRDVLLIAGGVGITPMRALFETMPIGPGQDLMLLYRARAPEELVFRRELDVLAAQRRARVIYLLGRNPDLLSSRSLVQLVPGLADRDVYLCGPPGMAGAVRVSLLGAGLPSSQLHEERFAF